MGKQVNIQVGGKDFFIDLLFYHTQLHCYVVIELKNSEFEPEHAGKLQILPLKVQYFYTIAYLLIMAALSSTKNYILMYQTKNIHIKQGGF